MAPPPPPWGPEDYLWRREVRGWTSGRHRAAFAVEQALLWVADTDTPDGWCWARDLTALDPVEAATPVRPLLCWALPRLGRHLVHAAAVGDARGAVLVAGLSGAGKSTTALAAALGGMTIAGDDHVLLEARGDEVVVHAPYRAGRISEASLELLPQLRPHARAPVPAGKRVVDLGVAFGERFAGGAAVRAVVVPRRAERTGAAARVDPRFVLRQLLSSTVLQMPAADDAVTRVLSALLERVPAYALDVGPDVAGRAAGALSALLDERAAA